MIHVIPIYNEKYNCIENILHSLAVYWGYECYMMSSEVWGFSYKSSDNTLLIGDRIHSNSGDYFKLFEQYHNVKIKTYDLNKKIITDYMDIISTEINTEHPVILMLDIFYCPWTKFYKLLHAIHYCMVVEVSEDKQAFYCIDPFYTLNVIELPLTNFEQGGISFITMRKLQQKEVGTDWRSVMKHAAIHYLGMEDSKAAYRDMCYFARDVKEHYHAADEFIQVGDKKFSHLSNQINYIRLARLSFSDFLEIFAQKYQIYELYKFSKRMLQAGQCWYNINIMFIKESFMEEGGLLIDRISRSILELAEQEKNLAIDLLQLTEKDLIDLNGKMEQSQDVSTEPLSQDDSGKTVTLIESHLLNIWKEVLETEAVNVHDNFFALGGDSYTLVMMHNRLDERYPGKIDVTDIFAYPTISRLAGYISGMMEIKEISDTRIMLMDLPEDFLFVGGGEDHCILSSNIDLDVLDKLKNVSERYHVQMSGIFLAGYIYMLYDETKNESICTYVVNKESNVQSVEINLEQIEDMADLIKTVDYELRADKIVPDLIFSSVNCSNRILAVFSNNGNSFDLHINHKLMLEVSESYEECQFKAEYLNVNKGKIKELFYKYIKIMNYIAQNQ